MAELVYPAPLRALDANGDPVGAAEAYFFRTGTTTPLTVYTDAGGGTAHPVPLVADANGVFAPVFNTSAFGVKVDIQDPASSESLPGYPINFAVATSTTTGAASSISFAPTEDVAETDVQSAIESVDVDWRAADATQQAVLDALGTAAVLDVSGDTSMADDPTAVPNQSAVKVYTDAVRTTLEALRPKGAGDGAWGSFSAGTGVALTLAAGGTWAYFFITYNGSGAVQGFGAGLAAGGSALTTADALNKIGVQWKVL